MATNGNPRQDPYIEHLDFLLSSFTDNGKSLENIPERGINLIKKVMTPHKIINDQIIFFYPIYLKPFLLRYQ